MIVYVTGTGNSRHVALRLAAHLQDTPTDAFAFLRSGEVAELTSEKPWVFVTPTYGWRLPRIFEAFLRRSRFSGSRDAYFIMTCGDDIGAAPLHNRTLCAQAGLQYRGTAAVVMPENYIALFDAPERAEAERIVAGAAPGIDTIGASIRRGETLPETRPSPVDRLKSGVVNAAFYRFVIKAGPFRASDACVGCGQCVRGCVTGNIRLRDGKPVWGETCTHCMACICLCPTAAIEYGKKSLGKPRYRCPAEQI